MKENGDTVVEKRSMKPTSGCKLLFTSIFFAAVAVVVDRFVITPVFLKRSNQGGNSEASVRYVENGAVDEEVVSLFVTYDVDLDGVLDLSEFVKVANRILHRKVADDGNPVAEPSNEGFETEWQGDDGELLTVNSYFTPLVLSTMSKYSDDLFSSIRNENQMQGLTSWKYAAVPMAAFPVKAFEAFLPNLVIRPTLGQPWYIVEPRIEKGGPGLISDRYYPPLVKGRLAIIYKLLAMFHHRPFLLTRFGPQGTVACVRAENKDYFDIMFRIHAEYQLNEPPLLPFWFTPGQFLGNVVIKKDGSHVHSFHLAVPNDRSLNVDMEWLVPEQPNDPDPQEHESGKENSEDSGNMEVDIGFLPQMELQSKMPSNLINGQEADVNENITGDNITWDKEISFEEAYKVLEEKFYGFKKVPYLPFKDAINQAKAENKLVHHILLWGALDDQSC